MTKEQREHSEKIRVCEEELREAQKEFGSYCWKERPRHVKCRLLMLQRRLASLMLQAGGMDYSQAYDASTKDWSNRVRKESTYIKKLPKEVSFEVAVSGKAQYCKLCARRHKCRHVRPGTWIICKKFKPIPKDPPIEQQQNIPAEISEHEPQTQKEPAK